MIRERSGESWWWLSFCDSDGFLGVSLVRGFAMIDASRAAHILGCNPGGEIVGMEIPASAGDPPAGYTNRILVYDEVKTMQALWTPENPGIASLGSLADDGDLRALNLLGEDVSS